MVVERDEPGHAVVRMVIRDDMTNGFHITHGGLVFALADTAFAIACNEDERVTVAAGADITFLKSTRAGQTLRAHAVRRSLVGRTGVYDVSVTDETGDVVAEFRGRSITTNRPFPEESA
jgi:acyl-CoA thioesterase